MSPNAHSMVPWRRAPYRRSHPNRSTATGSNFEILMATVVAVFGFTEFLPMEMYSFGCDDPCRQCSWPDECDTDQ